MTLKAIWIAIPARGGSKGIPRKNLKPLNGKPLIAHAIETARKALNTANRVVVITDDHEIANVAESFGASVILETQATPDDETLDEKIIRNLPEFYRRGAHKTDFLLTFQPTSPLIQPGRIMEAAEKLSSGATSVMSVTADKHLRWGVNNAGEYIPKYVTRLNRQQLPDEFRETGGLIGARLQSIEDAGTRVIQPVSLLELSERESVDIDTYSDFFTAEHWLTRLSIIIRVDGAISLGMGHLYRALAIAHELSRHDIRIVTSEDQPLGTEFFTDHPFHHQTVASDVEFDAVIRDVQPDLVVFDVLDTSTDDIQRVRSAAPAAKIITFEDLGSGAEVADLMVSELFENPRVDPDRQLTGVKNAILSPAFDSAPGPRPGRKSVDHILVLFGGTDPSGLAAKALRALDAIQYTGEITLIRGLGSAPLDLTPYKLNIRKLTHVQNMAVAMRDADLALSSAGRTLIELATSGVPTICMAQNVKELMHSHATQDNGIMMLGLGTELPDQVLEKALSRLISDYRFRTDLRHNALKATTGRRNQKILQRIFERIGLPTIERL